MAFDVRNLTNIETVEDFYRIANESPGMMKGKAAWDMHCGCGEPYCFINMFCKFYNDPFTEPEDVEDLISRWEAMPVIMFEPFDRITKAWMAEMQSLRQYRCYLAVKTAMTDGPGQMFSVDGEEIWISPDCPPPQEILDAMKEEIGAVN